MKGVIDGDCKDTDRNRLKICIVGVLMAALVILLLAGSTSSAKILIALSVFTFLIINVAGITSIHSFALRRRNILPVFILFTISTALLSVTGCLSEPGDVTKNETMTTPVATNATPSIGQTGTVSPAPYQLYIKAGQIYQFTYGGIFHDRRNFTVNYTSAYPTQIVKIIFNGYEKTIQKEQTDKPDAIYWSEGGFGFTLKPVLWEIRDGQRFPSYEVTWNTTELYFEVRESK